MVVNDRTRREIKQPKSYGYANLIAFALVAASEVLEEDPKTVKTVLASKEKEKWLSAMNEEIMSLHDNHTWELIKKTPVQKWSAASGSLKRKKASKELNQTYLKLDLLLEDSLKRRELTSMKFSLL